MVLERDGVCRNSHLSPKGHARHTRHADHATTNLQVKAPSADLSGSLVDRGMSLMSSPTLTMRFLFLLLRSAAQPACAGRPLIAHAPSTGRTTPDT